MCSMRTSLSTMKVCRPIASSLLISYIQSAEHPQISDLQFEHLCESPLIKEFVRAGGQVQAKEILLLGLARADREGQRAAVCIF